MNKRSVLYLDDEEICLRLFREAFAGEYDVRTAMTVSEARRILSESAAEIVISDQVMPELEGTEFLREVADQYPLCYRMMLTGNASVGDVVNEIRVGVVNLFVAKPWTQTEMRQALERASASYELNHKVRQIRLLQQTDSH